jgi:carbamoyl-phosphate synthase large subunit
LGLELFGTDANRWHLPLSLCDETFLIPLAREGESYRDALVTIVEKYSIDCIVPTHPVEVRAVAGLVEKGLLVAKVALPRTSVLDTTDDKAATQEALQSGGLAVPRTLVLDGPDDVDRAFAELTDVADTVWVRGSGAPGLGIGGAALPCRDAGVAKAWVKHHEGWGRMSASELLPGDNLTWMAVFAKGTLVAAAARERLEYVLPHVAPSGITGAPAVSRTIVCDEISRLGEAAVRLVDGAPHGAYFVDFKGDHENRPRVTEINAGRCGTTVHFYTEAGLNFPELLVKMALGQDLPSFENPHGIIDADLYWIRTLDCGPELVRGDDGFDVFPAVGR